MTTQFKNFETAVNTMFDNVQMLQVRKGYAELENETDRAIKVSKNETHVLAEQTLEDGMYTFVYTPKNENLREVLVSKQFLEVFVGGEFVETVLEKVQKRVKVAGSSFRKIVNVEVEKTITSDSGVNYVGRFELADFEETESGDLRLTYLAV